MWSLCRACLSRASLRPLLGGVARTLAAVTLLQVAENDGLPSLICLQCIQRMNNAFEFKKLCEDSDAKLRNCLEYRLNSNTSDSNANIADLQDIFKFNLLTQMKSESTIYQEKSNELSDNVTFDIAEKCNDRQYCRNGIKVECCTVFDPMKDSHFTTDSTKPEIKNISKSCPDDYRQLDAIEDLKNLIGYQQLDSFSLNLKEENDNHKHSDVDKNYIPIQNTNKSTGTHNFEDDNSVNSDDTAESKYPCAKCSLKFKTRKDLKRHTKLLHVKKKNGRSVSCMICNRSFSYRQTLTRHMRIHQDNPKNKLCTFCGKSFLRADDLKRHTRIHTGERPYSCDQCPKTYKQSSELKDHIKSHSAAKCYMCSECGKSLATRNGLYIHMKVHRGEKNRECKICGNKFVTNGELNSHINHIHLDEKPFKCSYSNCTRSFTTKLSLKTHIRAHTGEKPFKCTICDKSLATSSSLHEHKRIHTGEKPKKCTVCNKQLGNSQALKKHMRIHTGERPYQCKICFGKFICASTLGSHIKIKHMEKQHECNVCLKKFALATKLRQHMKLHVDGKTHSCQECDVTFNQISKLYQHMKSHDKSKEIVRNDVELDKTQLMNDIVTMPQLPMPHMLISQYL